MNYTERHFCVSGAFLTYIWIVKYSLYKKIKETGKQEEKSEEEPEENNPEQATSLNVEV